MKRVIAAVAVTFMTAGGGAVLGSGVAPAASTASAPTVPEIGGNYNQGLCDLYQGTLAHSGAQWVRTFVNIPRNFLAFDASGQLSGVAESNLTQWSDAVGGQGESLAIATATKLQQAKHTGGPGTPVKTVLSLKLDMKYLDVGVPTSATEYGLWLTAITQFLSTPSSPTASTAGPSPLGASVDVLVVGNEPMFEVPVGDAAAYGAFLDEMVDSLALLRSTNGWSYEIFTGALDRPALGQNDPILQQVLRVTNDNDNVDGLDLHLHEDSFGTLAADLGYIRTPETADGAGVTKPLSVTEFSLVGLWDAHENDLLSANTRWSAKYHYPSDWTMLDWLNSLLARAASGQPASAQEFGSYFQTQDWYPRHWFRRFVREFAEHGVVLATYGLSAPPGVPGLSDACGSSAAVPVPTAETAARTMVVTAADPTTTTPASTSTSTTTSTTTSTMPVATTTMPPPTTAPKRPPRSTTTTGPRRAAGPTTTTLAPPPPSTTLWVIDFLYNGAILGLGRDNLYVRNPLVADDFAAAVRAGGGR